ncbi:MAG: LysM peptidoglycan-binding domain-containing protein [Parachlamydiales bacterium]|nr:LysM peptidoglycan-binding domain-containing protein [Parachlamydiales bacterium]
MSKRDTIIIAILVNSGLLLILFFAAITNTEKPIDTSYEVAKYVQPEVFSEPTPILPAAENVVEEKPLAAKEEEKIIHPLPSLEEKVAPIAAIEEKKEETVAYTVVRGDTLEKVAKQYHTTVFALQQANNISNSFLKIGQVLKIPQFSQNVQRPSLSSVSSEVKYYVVKSGDNPWTIAMKHHMKISDLLKLNNLDNEKAKRLRPGDRLRIR